MSIPFTNLFKTKLDILILYDIIILKEVVMIYTVTLNPSIDHYIFTCKNIEAGATNRSEKTVDLCGGKGINVSIVCKSLGVDTVSAGFYGGFTGDELIRQINAYGIKNSFVKINAETRVNTKIVCGGTVTEINAKGPDINKEEISEMTKVLSVMTDKDTVVLSGSVPESPDLLPSVLKTIKQSGARFIADTSGKALGECIIYRPYLIKPNRAELAAYFGCDTESIDIRKYAEELLTSVTNVIVSDGERGAYFVNKSECRYLPVKDTGHKAKNATGAGDSMIAGYLYGEQNGIDPFVCAVCAGSASAYSEKLFDKSIFESVIKSYI